MSCCGVNKQCGPPPAAVVMNDKQAHVQQFYADKVHSRELGSNAPELCCLSARLPVPTDARHALDSLVHKDVINSSFGCGLPYPSCMRDCAVLDLGSGTGKDCFVLSYMCGPNGRVVGVDMTDKMIERSRQMIPYHADKFGFGNVEFKLGTLERLTDIDGVKEAGFDVVVSNCVINLCKDKRLVFEQVFRLLKEGGELFFSDIYGERPLPDQLVDDERVWNEGFAGALPWAEFVALCEQVGFVGPLVVDASAYKPLAPELVDALREFTFWSKTVRLFKPPVAGAATAGDGKKTVTYLGTIDNRPEFRLAQNTVLKTNEGVALPARVADTLQASRYSPHITVA